MTELLAYPSAPLVLGGTVYVKPERVISLAPRGHMEGSDYTAIKFDNGAAVCVAHPLAYIKDDLARRGVFVVEDAK